MTAPDRANNPKRRLGFMGYSSGMGALVSPADLEAAHERNIAKKKEQESFDRGEIKTINERLSGK